MAMTPLAGGNGRPRVGAPRYRPMSEINVTPFVDVMLVLLIVFMVTAPLLTVGVPIELPETQANPIQGDSEPLTVWVAPDGDRLLVWTNPTSWKVKRIRARGDVLDDRRAGRDVRALANRHWRDELRVAADERAVLDDGRGIVDPDPASSRPHRPGGPGHLDGAIPGRADPSGGPHGHRGADRELGRLGQ